MNILILSANIAAVIIIVLIVVYLTEDRRRFRVESQFRAVSGLFDEWVSLAAQCPGCGSHAAAYQKTKNISEKYRQIDAMISASAGHGSVRMLSLEQELVPFTQIYRGLAEPYNRALSGRLGGRIMRFLGFRPLPSLRFEAEDRLL